MAISCGSSFNSPLARLVALGRRRGHVAGSPISSLSCIFNAPTGSLGCISSNSCVARSINNPGLYPGFGPGRAVYQAIDSFETGIDDSLSSFGRLVLEISPWPSAHSCGSKSRCSVCNAVHTCARRPKATLLRVPFRNPTRGSFQERRGSGCCPGPGCCSWAKTSNGSPRITTYLIPSPGMRWDGGDIG